MTWTVSGVELWYELLKMSRNDKRLLLGKTVLSTSDRRLQAFSLSPASQHQQMICLEAVMKAVIRLGVMTPLRRACDGETVPSAALAGH